MKSIVTPIAWMEGAVRMASLGDFDRHARALEQLSRPLVPDLSKATELSGLLANNNKLHEVFSSVDHVSRSWRDMTSAMDKIGKGLSRSLLLESQIARQIELSAAAQATLSGFDVGKFESLFKSPALEFPLVQSIDGLFGAYRDWVEEISLEPAGIVAIPVACSAFPPIEVFNEAEILADEDAEEAAEFSVERDRIRTGILADADQGHGTLEECGFGDLIPLILGARDAVVRQGYDHVRHAVTSLREAVTQVLHRLAPDEAIEKWSTSDKDYDKGKPTRRARLRYIYRQIDSGKFGEFVVRDVEATLALFDVFQQGTHGVSIEMEQRKLSALVIRVDCLVQFLVNIERADR